MIKGILKDYGALIGPSVAFLFGVLAVCIKYLIDRRMDVWQANKKFRRLIIIIHKSAPPKKYYPGGSKNDFHADQARNLTNLSIFKTRLNVLEMYIEKIENEVLLNCNIQQVQQFNQVRFIVSYLIKNVESYRNVKKDDKSNRLSMPYLEPQEFQKLTEDYDRIIRVCGNPNVEFQYTD
jgi:hypothetical protein